MSGNQWLLAKSFIDAKKCVDSIMYIAIHFSKLSRLNIYGKIETIRNEFFINLCTVLDKSFSSKRDLCAQDETVKYLYYERDKNSAHKDSSYKPRVFKTLDEMVEEMKKQILHVRAICNHTLPNNLTLDFVPHDKELYRYINQISAEEENAALKEKYNFRELTRGTCNFETFENLEDDDEIYLMKQYEDEDVIIPFEEGLNPYETLQNLQDTFIKLNIKGDKNIWDSVNYSKLKIWELLKDHGFINEFGMFYMDDIEDFDKWETYLSIINDAKSIEANEGE